MEVFVFFPQLKGSSVPRSRPKCTLPKLYNRCSLSVSVKHATRLSPPLRAGHFAGGTRVVFLGRSAPPRALITVAIHPRAYARGILAHTSKNMWLFRSVRAHYGVYQSVKWRTTILLRSSRWRYQKISSANVVCAAK